MLRKILIILMLIIVLLPFLGFPHEFDIFISTGAALLVIVLLVFSPHGKLYGPAVEHRIHVDRRVMLDRRKSTTTDDNNHADHLVASARIAPTVAHAPAEGRHRRKDDHNDGTRVPHGGHRE